jgi:hypothetical protein
VSIGQAILSEYVGAIRCGELLSDRQRLFVKLQSRPEVPQVMFMNR